MAIVVLVIDLPTWLVATAGACALAVLVWQGRARTARRNSETAPEQVEDEWYVVAEGPPDAVDEAAPVVSEGAPDDVADVAPVVGEWAPENATAAEDVADVAPEDVADVAPVLNAAAAAPAPVPDTTPAQYYYTPNGRRVHTRCTCWGLRNAKAIVVSPTHELSGKTKCHVCFLG